MDLILLTALIGFGGVIVGAFITGAISIIAQFMSNKFEFKRWRKEKAIENLRVNKKDLEEKWEKYRLDIQNSNQPNRYMYLYSLNYSF